MARALHFRGRIRSLHAIALAGVVATILHAPRVAYADEPSFGMMVDAGLPSGMTGAIALRPTPRLRFHVGVSHNLVGPGVRGGAAVRFTTGTVSPTLSLEAGRFARANAGWLSSAVGAESDTASLRELAYTYGAGHAGLDVGGDDATFFVEVGAAAVRGDLYFRDVSDQAGVQMDVRAESGLDFWTLSGRAGVLVWF